MEEEKISTVDIPSEVNEDELEKEEFEFESEE